MLYKTPSKSFIIPECLVSKGYVFISFYLKKAYFPRDYSRFIVTFPDIARFAFYLSAK